MKTKMTIKGLYNHSGFQALAQLKPHPWDEGGWIVTLRRRQKNSLFHLWAIRGGMAVKTHAYGAGP